MQKQNRSPLTLLLVLLTVIATLALAGAATAQDDAAMKDAYTELRVKTALLEKLGRDALSVDVDAGGGTVQLAGTVTDRATQELAEEVARAVEGVTRVNSDLRVRPKQPPERGDDPGDEVQEAVDDAELELEDALVESKVKVALVDAIGFDAFEVEVEATNGVVTLRGEVDADERDDALAAARGVSQVDKVIDLLESDSD